LVEFKNTLKMHGPMNFKTKRDYLNYLGVNGMIKIKMDLKEVGWEDGLDLCGSK
jgi:hypothetical protein